MGTRSIVDFEVLALSFLALCWLQARLCLEEIVTGLRGDREKGRRWSKRLAEGGQLLARRSALVTFIFSQGGKRDDAQSFLFVCATRLPHDGRAFPARDWAQGSGSSRGWPGANKDAE